MENDGKIIIKPVFGTSSEEKIEILEAKVNTLTIELQNVLNKLDKISNKKRVKKELIPNTCLYGTSKGKRFILTVGAAPNTFYVGPNSFNSLSAAAEKVSGVRRSGLTFWAFQDGKTVKEYMEED